MDLIAFGLTEEYSGEVEIEDEDGKAVKVPKFGGGVLAVGDGDIHLRDELDAGGGAICVHANDQRLVDLLRAYPALEEVDAPAKPAKVVNPYDRRQDDDLRHLASLRDLDVDVRDDEENGDGLDRQEAIDRLTAADLAQGARRPDLIPLIAEGDPGAIKDALSTPTSSDGLAKLRAKELEDLADKHNVPLDEGATNPEKIDALRAAGVRKD